MDCSWCVGRSSGHFDNLIFTSSSMRRGFSSPFFLYHVHSFVPALVLLQNCSMQPCRPSVSLNGRQNFPKITSQHLISTAKGKNPANEIGVIGRTFLETTCAESFRVAAL